MDAVMMLTAVASRLGDRCGLVAFDRRVRSVVNPGPGHRQLSRVTEAMYELEPELAESDYQGAFTETLALPPPGDVRDPHRPRRAGGGGDPATGAPAHPPQPRRGRGRRP